MFYISFVVGEDQFYYWADTDSVDEANKSWFEHVASSPEFSPFDHSARRELYDPVLMRDETAVWSLASQPVKGTTSMCSSPTPSVRSALSRHWQVQRSLLVGGVRYDPPLQADPTLQLSCLVRPPASTLPCPTALPRCAAKLDLL